MLLQAFAAKENGTAIPILVKKHFQVLGPVATLRRQDDGCGRQVSHQAVAWQPV
jgi:hypothetical protein